MFYRYGISLIINLLKENKGTQILNRIKNILRNQGLFKNNDIIKSLKSINYINKHVVDEIVKEINLDLSAYLKENKPYLCTPQIHELKNAGFYIGGHSVDHPLYSEIAFKEQISQTDSSINFVKERFNVDYKIFAFPHSDKGIKSNFFKKVLEEDKIADLIFANSGIKKDIDPRIIQRVSLENPGKLISKVIISEHLYSTFNKLTGNYIIKRD